MNMSDPGANRRADPRFEVMAQVRVKRGKVDYIMDLTNISRSGALVNMGSLKTPAWVQHGRVVEIAIIHPVDLDTLQVKGEIVRIQKNKDGTLFAVRFVELTAEENQNINRLLDCADEEHPPEQPRVRPPPLPT